MIYSRDSLLHVEDKPVLLRRMLKWLRPGGRLLVTDYCCSDEDATAQVRSGPRMLSSLPLSVLKLGSQATDETFAAPTRTRFCHFTQWPEFKFYLNRRGYTLYSPTRYGTEVASAGFAAVSAEDQTDQAVMLMEGELARFQRPESKSQFVDEFGGTATVDCHFLTQATDRALWGRISVGILRAHGQLE